MPPEKGTGQRWDFNADTNLVQILATNAAGIPDQIALREKDRGIWQQTTWAEWLELVLSCAAGLEELGFTGKDGLLVLGDNRPNLYTGMLAAASLAGHAMPVYPDATGDEIRHVLTHADVRFVLAEDQEQVDKILELRDATLPLERIIYDDPRGLGAYEDSGLVSWQKLIVQGTARLKNEPGLREQLIARAKPDDALVFIHSSGTTGRPKGVVLSHRNVLSGVANAYKAKAFGFGEEVLAYLPMAWVGDFAFTVAAGVALRFTINIPERPRPCCTTCARSHPPSTWRHRAAGTTCSPPCRCAWPTPRWLKKVYDFFMSSAWVRAAQARRQIPDHRRALVAPAGRGAGLRPHQGPARPDAACAMPSPAAKPSAKTPSSSTVPWACSCASCTARPRAAPTTRCRSVRGAAAHRGPAAAGRGGARSAKTARSWCARAACSAATTTSPTPSRDALVDGWLHTGDAGYLEPDGHLVVLGRVSEVVHTAKGERYIPNYIENRLKFSPWVKDVAVLGAGRDWLGAIVCIDKEPVGHWAELRRHLVHVVRRPVAAAR
jgi:long-chain acyl-CoA synthetase